MEDVIKMNRRILALIHSGMGQKMMVLQNEETKEKRRKLSQSLVHEFIGYQADGDEH